MEVPGLGVESELQLPAYTTATATQDLSRVCDLHPWKLKLKTKQNKTRRIPIVVQWVTNPTTTHEDAGLIPGLAQWIKDMVLL